MKETEIRDGWLLPDAPSYEGGILSEAAYNIGGGLDISPESEIGRMQVIRETNGAEFAAYCQKLETRGYERVYENAYMDNRFVQYRKNGALLYTYYIAAWGEVRVIDDVAGVSVPEFEYVYEPAEGESIALYQYAMMFNRNGNGNQKGDPYGNCGMFFILRLADNSVVLIDGGDIRQATAKAAAELMKFLREITHTTEKEKVRIASIFISHFHDDHKRFLDRLVDSYSDQIVIERAFYNLPTGCQPSFPAFGRKLAEKFPETKFLKAHTGQKIRMGGMLIEVVTTHEDMVDAVSGRFIARDQNNTSTPLKLTINGRTMMMLTDWGGGHTVAPPEYEVVEPRFFGMYQSGEGEYAFIKSDIIQVTHHALNPYMGKVNAAIGAEYAFFPAADVEMASQAHPNVVNVNYDQLLAAGTDPEKVYFASRYTYCLDFARDGTITVAAEPIRGADTEDDPNTPNLDRHGVPQEHLKEQDYVNVTLKAYRPYRVPTDGEFANWALLHQ